uniref:Uncharacterized protein n=1 Tax=Lygus hesperus TaxID=30085 RepID=A0A0A9YKX6_LYGHE
MLLRNFSSCRFRVPSLSIAGKSTNLGDSISSYFLQKCSSRVLDQLKRGLSEKSRDPKDFTRYSGRPDDPPKKARKWTGRPVGPCEQKDDTSPASELKTPTKWTGRSEDTSGDHKKSPRMGRPPDDMKKSRWTGRPEDTNKPGKRQTESAVKVGRPTDTKRNGKWTGRPEETCEYPGKQNQDKSLASPAKSDNSSTSGKSDDNGFGNSKASIAAASLPNISGPIHPSIVNVEMSKATELSPPDSLTSSSTTQEVPYHNQMLTGFESERIQTDATPTEKVIAIQEIVSAQLGGVLGQSKTGLNNVSASFKTNNVGPELIATSPLEPTATSPKIGGWFPEQYVDVMSQRSSLQPTRISPGKQSTTFPVEAEQLKPLSSTLAPQIPELKRSVSRKTSLDVKIPGAPKLKGG